MANTNFPFPSTLQKTGDPNFRGVGNWDFCSRMHFWGVRGIFLIFHKCQTLIFHISINTRKTGDPNFRGVGNWDFCSRTHFWGVRGIFLIFHNGQHQFYISVNTQKTTDPNFIGSVIGTFALGCIFGELEPFF